MYALGDRSQILLSKLKEYGAPPAAPDGDAQQAAGTEGGTEMAGADRVERLGKLARDGDAEAQVALGDLHMVGRGVLHNYSLAMGWYKRAADAGNSDAQFKLAGLYRDGQGVPVYPERSRELLARAAEQGHPDARESLRRMGIEPPPIKEKNEAPPGEGTEGEGKQAEQAGADGEKAEDEGDKAEVQAPVEAGPPRVHVRLAGMEDPSGELEPALIALVRRLVAAVNGNDVAAVKDLAGAEYAACASDENGPAYDAYLTGLMAHDIAAGYAVSLGALEEGAPLPFTDLVSYPVVPTHYLKIDLRDPPLEPGDGERRFGDTHLQYVVNRDGAWSLVLGCPTAKGLARMQMAEGDAK